MAPGPEDKPSSRRAAKAWSGRLQEASAPTLEEFSSSLPWDTQLADHDIQGSRAHARALGDAGLVDPSTLGRLLSGLDAVAGELSSGTFAFLPSDEDIHMAVERRLTELIGESGQRLHTGRSRNDQVAVDLRLYARRACVHLVLAVADLQEVLLQRAREQRSTVLPGYTHMQRGQPVHVAHHLLAYLEMLNRDRQRLQDCRGRADESPLGAGGLAGTTLPIQREGSAADMGFTGLTANSLDAVSDRDFAVELVFDCALMGVHLSRLAEDLIIWNTAEFSFITLPDRWATGSSLMPQKKNPDLLELVRGRAAVPISSLVGLLTLLKGLPLSYNRDLQEDKRHLFAAVEVTLAGLLAMRGLLAELQFNRRRMALAASDPELLATDLAEFLVLEGIPFRRAHEMVGQAVFRARQDGVPLHRLIEDRGPELGMPEQAGRVFDLRRSLSQREQVGAPGPRATGMALRRASRQIASGRSWARLHDGGRPSRPAEASAAEVATIRPTPPSTHREP